MNRQTFLLNVLVFSQLAQAQVEARSDVHIGVFTQSNCCSLQLTPTNQNLNEKVSYRPNTKTFNGYQLSYGWFTLFYLTADDESKKDSSRYGKTSYEDLRRRPSLAKMSFDSNWAFGFEPGSENVKRDVRSAAWTEAN